MVKQIFFFGCFLFFSSNTFAALRSRTGTEILSLNSEAIDLHFQSFSKKLSFDESGAQLISADSNSFSVNDWTLKYTRGLYSDLEGSFFGNYRTVKPDSPTTTSNSGLESIGLEGKYILFARGKYKNAIGLRFKKAMFSNTRYTISTTPPSDKVVLGDDGLEYEFDYLLTFYDKYLKYDFKLGYNKPSSDLSSEIIYNAAAFYYIAKVSLTAGIGGIYSLKNDAYTDSPSSKPLISSGNSRLFNSVNRQKAFFYGGIEYAFTNFIVGFRGESIFSARSTDTGNAFSLNIRWENNQISDSTGKIKQNYFTEGFVKQLSTKGLLIKINIGSKKQLTKGDQVDIYSLNDESRSIPLATGTIFEVGPEESIVKIKQKFKNHPIQVACVVKVY